jgi:hypothetical protein
MGSINILNNNLSGSSGSGKFVGSNSPTFTTPNLGAASATSINFGGSTLENFIDITPFTPSFTFNTVGDLSVTYTAQTGYYTRIGNMVFINIHIACTPTWTTSSGSINITGLPINVAAYGQTYNPIVLTTSATYVSPKTLLTTIFSSSPPTIFNLLLYGNHTGAVEFKNTSITSGNPFEIYVSGRYFC